MFGYRKRTISNQKWEKTKTEYRRKSNTSITVWDLYESDENKEQVIANGREESNVTGVSVNQVRIKQELIDKATQMVVNTEYTIDDGESIDSTTSSVSAENNSHMSNMTDNNMETQTLFSSDSEEESPF